MTVHLVTFATDDMSRALDVCVKSAWQNGVPRHNLHDWTFTKLCDMPLMELRSGEYWAERGVGYWLWKSYIIEKEIRGLADGDVLIYSDAGVEFINNVSHIIDRMDQDIFLFGNNWEHAHWCKRDVIDAIFSKDTLPEYTHWTLPVEWGIFGKQAQASVIFFRVSKRSRDLVAEWLHWCLFEGGRLIDDSPSRLPNHPEFREHRHDQAILTTMAYREGIKLHYWPAQYNDGAFSYPNLEEYARDDYPILFHHHRRRNHEWSNAA